MFGGKPFTQCLCGLHHSTIPKCYHEGILLATMDTDNMIIGHAHPYKWVETPRIVDSYGITGGRM